MGIGGGELLGVSIYQREGGWGMWNLCAGVRFCYTGGTLFSLVENGHLGNSEEVEGKRNLFIFFFFRGKEMLHGIYSNGRATGNFSEKKKRKKISCLHARMQDLHSRFPSSSDFFYFSADLNLLLRGNAVR